MSVIDVAAAPSVSFEFTSTRVARPRAIRIGLLGYGQVGQAVAALVHASAASCRERGLDLTCTSALVRDTAKPRSGPRLPLSTEPRDIFGASVDVIIEVLGGLEPARTLVAGALRARIPVVSANKSLIATHGWELRAIAAAHATPLFYDAAVVAGVPFLGALTRRPTLASLRRVTGIVNGTSHFIVSELARGASFVAALAEAQRRGFAEPDSSADVSGRDAAEKLAILLHVGGVPDVTATDFPRVGVDAIGPNDLMAAKRLGGTIKPVAMASLEPHFAGAWVGPAFVDARHPFHTLDGVANAVQWTGGAGHTVSFGGPGAGPDVTAVTLVDDAIEAVAGNTRAVTLDHKYAGDAGASLLTRPPTGAWILRVRGAETWRATDLAATLTARHLPALQVLSSANEWFVRTSSAPWHQVQYVLTSLRARGADVAAFPVL